MRLMRLLLLVTCCLSFAAVDALAGDQLRDGTYQASWDNPVKTWNFQVEDQGTKLKFFHDGVWYEMDWDGSSYTKVIGGTTHTATFVDNGTGVGGTFTKTDGGGTVRGSYIKTS